MHVTSWNISKLIQQPLFSLEYWYILGAYKNDYFRHSCLAHSQHRRFSLEIHISFSTMPNFQIPAYCAYPIDSPFCLLCNMLCLDNFSP